MHERAEEEDGGGGLVRVSFRVEVRLGYPNPSPSPSPSPSPNPTDHVQLRREREVASASAVLQLEDVELQRHLVRMMRWEVGGLGAQAESVHAMKRHQPDDSERCERRVRRAEEQHTLDARCQQSAPEAAHADVKANAQRRKPNLPDPSTCAGEHEERDWWRQRVSERR